MPEDYDQKVKVVNSAAEPVVVSGQLSGQLVVSQASFTRPGDATAYTAKDAIANAVGGPSVIAFDSIVPEDGGSGYLTKARAMTDLKTWIARIRLHLFHTLPTPIADNSPYLLLWANRAARVGYVDFPFFTTEDSTNSTAAYSSVTDLRLPFICDASEHRLFALAEVLDAASVVGGQGFFFELTADVN